MFVVIRVILYKLIQGRVLKLVDLKKVRAKKKSQLKTDQGDLPKIVEKQIKILKSGVRMRQFLSREKKQTIL